MILGNKCDLHDEKRVDIHIGREAAAEFDTIFAEVSAKTDHGIDKV